MGIMEMERKDLIIIVLSICLIFTSITGILLSFQPSGIQIMPPELDTLVIGTSSGPNDLDPTDSWDAASNDVIEQVVETLFTYDTRQFAIDETMPRINWLATGYSWDMSNTILTVDIRTGVRFHDGTIMDAAAVAWSFNRFIYLMNHTGELPSDGRAVKVHSLYEFPNGDPVFESVIASDADIVVFTLTAPYAPILDAMCYISCGILSPSSTPTTQLIDRHTRDLVGTGPYEYDYYITDTEVSFSKFDDYWATAAPYNLEDPVMFDAMVYSIIDDPSALNYAMLAGDIDILFGAMTDLLPAFRTNPWIKVYEDPKPGLVYQYLCFNTHQINVTWRKSMSYAINYSYIIDKILEGRAHRAYGAISPSFGSGFNHWLRDAQDITPGNGSAVYNLSIARQTLIDDPKIHTGGLTANNDPNDATWEAANLGSYNYSYNTDNWFRSALYPLLENWFDDIGITLEDGGWDWGYWIRPPSWYTPGGYDQLQIYFIGWGPDYLDPFNLLNPLFSNISVSNACQINDPWIMGNLSLALQTTDDTTRNKIYWDIQWRLFAELYVHAPIYHNMVTTVHAADLYDIGYNSMGRWWALSVKRNLTWVPNI
jgi:ABC-type transport system substrate-binding protein